MNELIRKLSEQAQHHARQGMVQSAIKGINADAISEKYAKDFEEKFAELIVAKVLDEVAERAYYSGDRAWSDELDRRRVELEFGMGELAELKNERPN